MQSRLSRWHRLSVNALGAVLTVMVLFSGGCGWMSDDRGMFVDPRDDYLDAKPGPQLVVPEGLEEEAVVDPLPIPPTPVQTNANYFPDRPPLPDAIYGDEKAEEVRMQRIGQRRWLVVPEEPTTVWPKIKQFFAENGIQVANEAPGDGRIDTQWLLMDGGTQRGLVRRLLEQYYSAGSDTVDRVLIRVESGLKDRTSEIHLRHLQQPAAAFVAPPEIPSLSSMFEAPAAPKAPATLPRPPYQANLTPVVSSNAEAESDLLRELGAYIAAKVSEQLVSMIATNIETEPKAVMERNNEGLPALRLNLDLERAWASVGQALDNAEVEVLSSERENLTYGVAVDETTFSGEEPGFFGRMFSFGSGAQNYNLKLTPVVGSNNEAYWVTVLDDEQQAPSRDTAQQLLVLVREFSG